MTRRLTVALLLAAGACRGNPDRPVAWDVGVPLSALPRSEATELSALVPGPVLLYAEASDPAALLASVESTPGYTALERSGGLAALALSGPAATATALVQRLNDLSRSPIGEEAIRDLLDGPLALALRSRRDGGTDLLLVKALTPRSTRALKLAEMLQAVHASATEVRVERHDGLPLRHIRLDGERRLTYAVLRDRLVLGTDVEWVRGAVDLAVGQGHTAPVAGVVAAMRARREGAAAWAVLDAERATQSKGLGAVGRALSGLEWLALRWSVPDRLDVGIRRAHGAFGKPGSALAPPPGALLSITREATLAELLAAPPSAADGGIEPGRALIDDVARQLGPTLGNRAAYALTRVDGEHGTTEHALAWETPQPQQAAQALRALAPRLFRATPERRDELGPGALCVGAPPALCFGPSASALWITTSPADLHAALEPSRAVAGSNAGAAALSIDVPALGAALAHTHHAPRPTDGGAADADPLLTALAASHPLRVDLHPAADTAEAWGTVASASPTTKPKGGAP